MLFLKCFKTSYITPTWYSDPPNSWQNKPSGRYYQNYKLPVKYDYKLVMFKRNNYVGCILKNAYSRWNWSDWPWALQSCKLYSSVPQPQIWYPNIFLKIMGRRLDFNPIGLWVGRGGSGGHCRLGLWWYKNVWKIMLEKKSFRWFYIFLSLNIIV